MRAKMKQSSKRSRVAGRSMLAHLSVVKQYEGTIAELQTSLAAAGQISSVEAQYAHSMQEATEQNKSIESNISSRSLY